MWALFHWQGRASDFPREGVMAVGGFTSRGIPIVILVDMETETVFHAQGFERKYERLFKL